MLIRGVRRELRGGPTVEWLEGGCFLVQHVEFNYFGETINGIEVIATEDTMTDNSAAQAPAQQPTPDPALKQLDILVGMWNVEGAIMAGPAGPAARAASVQTFEWLEGGFCLVHRWEIHCGAASEGWDTHAAGDVDKGIQLWWYDTAIKKYCTQFFNTLGGPAGYEGEVRDGVLTFTGPARHTLVPNDDGSITWNWELPSDESTWSPWMHLTMTKVR